MAGFPAGAPEVGTASGILHLAFGLIQFLALAAATVVVAGWFARRGDGGTARYSRISGAVVLVGFAGGAALSALARLPVVVAGWRPRRPVAAVLAGISGETGHGGCRSAYPSAGSASAAGVR